MNIKPWLLLAIVNFLSACSEPPPPVPEAAVEQLSVNVKRFPAVPWSYPLETSGVLQSAETVDIAAEAAGVVTKVLVKEGQAVQQGQLLMRLDNEKQNLRVERARAIRASSEADMDQAQRQWQKFSQLRETGAVSDDQLDNARSHYDALKARFQSAQAELELAQRELADRDIRSPIAGVVDGEPIEQGERVQPGQALIEIQAQEALQVITWVNQAEVNQLKLGTPVEVRSDASNKVYRARVEAIAQSAHPRTGNFEVKCRLSDADVLLREGMSASVRIDVESNRKVLFIPRTAVVDRQRKAVVFVVNQGIAERREPRFGLPSGDEIPVLSGLESDEMLILSPLELITDGLAVTVETQP
ncbi:MAG: efflux RND transporter periplasmic adaptor subunit [Pseudomonadota bacterium]|jgi:membrane fusion protein (multidrug efflux system)|uniref:efflux RND transporter periplasmic adaptor subunit n=2 Tax=Spongiibacter marinus TaxID=354246 RepID=UPI002E8A1AC6|nr:efflux RND transporter periplasmic adaptor subunit [Pseudomonadota bacterium]